MAYDGSYSFLELDFGFLEPSDLNNLQSTDYNQRISISQKLLDTFQQIDTKKIELSNLLQFLEKVINDENFSVAQNLSSFISKLIAKVDPDEIKKNLRYFISIAITQLLDSRRFIFHLGQNLLCDLITILDDEVVIRQIASQVTPSAKSYTAVFRCITSLLSQGLVKPLTLIQFPFFFDDALNINQTSVRQAILWCLDNIKKIEPKTYDILISLLSKNSINIITKGNYDTKRGQEWARQINTAENVTLKSLFSAKQIPKINNTSNGHSYQRPLLPSGMKQRNQAVLGSIPSRLISTSHTTPVNNDLTDSLETNQNLLSNENNFSKTQSIFLPSTILDDEDVIESPVEEEEEFEEKQPSPQTFPPPSNAFSKTQPIPTPDNFDFLDSPKNETENKRSVIKRSPVHKRLINRDVIIKTRSHSITTNSSHNILSDYAAIDSQPIQTSGHYDLGDGSSSPIQSDVESKSKSLVRPKPKPRQLRVKPRRQSNTTFPVPPPKKQAPKVTFQSVYEQLSNSEWNVQNDGILNLIPNIDKFITPIITNLKDIIMILLECSSSLRSTLAKNALNCLLKLLKNDKIDFDRIADSIAPNILQLLTSSHHFISSLAGECFIALINAIPIQQSIDILIREHNRKHAACRIKIAFCLSTIISKTTNYSKLMKTLADLMGDANQEVRKYAKCAVCDVVNNVDNFDQLLADNLQNDTDRNVLRNAIAK
ncbi:hypothetical protein GPJ56_009057 [Histomonas meleagridis]|uniref:uncharacterized protein n=1 Tax=Histomonas meleagridis TaxID=135588 RepID=UPI0035596433|nr:hypothetical protein GPJ56_009057 [Histomonas meleagridis]KAH0799287.1 hypothetical protein GO595_008084 [Histomonas meleagridis]